MKNSLRWLYQNSQNVDIIVGIVMIIIGLGCGIAYGFETWNHIVSGMGLLSIVLGKVDFARKVLSRVGLKK